MSAFADERYMRRALELAERGVGWVNPNPLVGCVLMRDDVVLAEGWHHAFGSDHAEVEALNAARKAGVDVAGATLYVTLEPCAHEGKTPACAPIVAASGVARVVVALGDPFEKVDGAGIALLRAAGVVVDVGVLAPEVQWQNRIFLHWVAQQTALKPLPYVAVKVAVSADDMITRAHGTTTAVTGEEAREFVHELRSRFDAVLVGAQTVQVDDPLLNVRYGVNPHQPVPVVVDGRASVSAKARVFHRDRALVCVGESVRSDALPHYPSGVTVLRVPDSDGHMDFRALLAALWDHGVHSVLIEGGQQVLTQVVEQRLAQEWWMLRSSAMFGEGQLFIERPSLFMEQYVELTSRVVGDDTAICFVPKPHLANSSHFE